MHEIESTYAGDEQFATDGQGYKNQRNLLDKNRLKVLPPEVAIGIVGAPFALMLAGYELYRALRKSD